MYKQKIKVSKKTLTKLENSPYPRTQIQGANTTSNLVDIQLYPNIQYQLKVWGKLLFL